MTRAPLRKIILRTTRIVVVDVLACDHEIDADTRNAPTKRRRCPKCKRGGDRRSKAWRGHQVSA